MTDFASDACGNSDSHETRLHEPVTNNGNFTSGNIASPSHFGSNIRRKVPFPRVSVPADSPAGDVRTSQREPRSSSGECTSIDSLTGKRERECSPNTNGTTTNGTKETYESDNTVHRNGHSGCPDFNGNEQHQSADMEEGEGSPNGKCDKGKLPRPEGSVACPRCASEETKFCYYNNYNINQPRYFCKACQRYWTAGGTLRNVPVGSGRRKNKSASKAKEQSIGTSSASKSGKLDMVAPYQFQPMLLDPLYAATVAQTPDLQAALTAQFMPAALSGSALNPTLGAVAAGVPPLPLPQSNSAAPGNLTQIAEHLRQLQQGGQSQSSDARISSCTAGPADLQTRSSLPGASHATDLSEDGSIGGRRVRLKTPGAQSLNRSGFGGAFAPPATTANESNAVSSSGLGAHFLSPDSSLKQEVPDPTAGAPAALAQANTLQGFQPLCNQTTSDVSLGSLGSLQKTSMDWLSYAAAANHQQQAAAHQLQQAAALQAQAQLQAAAAAGWTSAQNPYLSGLWPYGLYNTAAPNWAAYSRFGPLPGWMDPTAAASLAAAAQAQAQLPRPPSGLSPPSSAPPPVPSIIYPTAQRTSAPLLQQLPAAVASPVNMGNALPGAAASIPTSQTVQWPGWPNFAPGLAWPGWPGMPSGVTPNPAAAAATATMNNGSLPIGGQLPGLLQAKALQAMQMQHTGFDALVNNTGESAVSRNSIATHALGL